MRQLFVLAIVILQAITVSAQETCDSIFKGKLVNQERQVWLVIDFYNKNISVPKQEILGTMPGYLGAKQDSRNWLIIDADIKDNTAYLTIVNDYGSEDLTATLTWNANGTYTLQHESGSNIKIAINRKWVKLPPKLVFTQSNEK